MLRVNILQVNSHFLFLPLHFFLKTDLTLFKTISVPGNWKRISNGSLKFIFNSHCTLVNLYVRSFSKIVMNNCFFKQNSFYFSRVIVLTSFKYINNFVYAWKISFTNIYELYFIARCFIDSIREIKDRFIKYIFTNLFSMSGNKSGLSFLAFFAMEFFTFV